MAELEYSFWHDAPETAFQKLRSTPAGLSAAEAAKRLLASGRSTPDGAEWWPVLRLLIRQFTSPLILILVFAVALSFSLGETTNATLIFAILLMTGLMGFFQEFRAGRAVKKLRSMVHATSSVYRDGKLTRVKLEQIVPGDVISLAAGDIVPGDCLLTKAKDLHVNEAALTGESFPAEKDTGLVPENTPLDKRSNALFMGSHIINGEGDALVICTGGKTELGRMTASLLEAPEETNFEKGINQFGFMLMRLTFILATGILILNLSFHQPIIESILFALALAVGLAPELLPAIMTTTLSAGAVRMSKKQVIVKKLSAIQNLGAIDILCSDKTGTLTTGSVEVQSTVGINNKPSSKVRQYAWLNARFETGFSNPLDEALRKLEDMQDTGFTKFDEVPYDFIRKRLSIVVEKDGRHLMITKGALKNVLEVCDRAEDEDGIMAPIETKRAAIFDIFENCSGQGFRTIGIAWKDITGDPVINKDDEREMVFLGFIFLYDPPKPRIDDTVRNLKKLGIRLKMITGDNRLVASHLGHMIGLKNIRLLTGEDMRNISDEGLPARALRSNVFAEIDPSQKERLVRALRQTGHVIGYIGDGINDASALRTADVGISVDSAADVAREASDLILLKKDLDVLRDGILEGRKTYINTLKYIFITTSANFGNMFSLAGISLFIPFLPMLPQQILLINFLSDIPALGIAGDRVDEEQLSKPKRWNVKLIKKFMTVFGLQSSLFDYLTFLTLLLLFRVDQAHFQSGWFIESVITELMILLIIRTTRPVFRSKPSRFLLFASLGVGLFVIVLPYLHLGKMIGFAPLPLPLLISMIGIAALYGVLIETSKGIFFRRFNL